MRARADHSEPVFNIPPIIMVLLGLMVVVQFARSRAGVAFDDALIARFAFVPGRLTFAFDPVGVLKHIATATVTPGVGGRTQALWIQAFLQRGGTAPWTLLTYAFLHGGWTHLGLNGVWMVAFGTPVARRFGTGPFLTFMAVAAVFGALAHWLCYPFGFAPVVGASAAISGLMGAAVRFMFQAAPGEGDVATVRPLPLAAVFRDRRALSFIVVWFVTNGLFGVGAGSLGLSDAPVAWQAHVGGFLAGLLLFPWFDPVRGETPERDETTSMVDPATVPHED